MMELGYTPKHVLIANQLRRQILAGQIKAGEKIRPDTVLADVYGVNKRTVAHGMEILVDEGLISRSPGRGTVVLCNETENHITNAVGIFMYNSGDFYGNISSELSQGLLKQNLYPVWVNQGIFGKAVYNPDCSGQVQQIMEKILNDSPYGMIIEGERFMPFDFLRRNLHRIRNLVFIHLYLCQNKIPGAKYVIVDEEEIGRLASNYLIAQGHRILTFIAPKEYLSPPAYPLSPQRRIANGMREACRKAGCFFIDEIPERMLKGDHIRQILADTLQSGTWPTGCLLWQDSVWEELLSDTLASMNLSCPADLSVVGCYNTPWGERSIPKLSSISLNEQIMARKALELLRGEYNETEVIIHPEIVERESVLQLI